MDRTFRDFAKTLQSRPPVDLKVDTKYPPPTAFCDTPLTNGPTKFGSESFVPFALFVVKKRPYETLGCCRLNWITTKDAKGTKIQIGTKAGHAE